MGVIEIEDKYSIQFCNRQSIVIDRGQGSYVWDEDGVRYLDFTSGWGVTCLGHSHPVVVKALTDQVRKLTQNPNSGFTYSPPRARLLESLGQLLPGNLSRMFFVNSGAEANDAAIKLARKVTGKSRVISTRDSFHGRTFNTLSVSGGEENTNRYVPVSQDTRFVEFGNLEDLEAALDTTTAAVIVEPVQGEGGVRLPSNNYLQEVARLCKQYSTLLIIDEIQTGFCRTGRFFAVQHSTENFEFDILTMGKGIAGGFPFGGIAVSENLSTKLEKGDHGGTYCGNPLGCAVAEAVISYLQEHEVAAQVEKTGEYLLRRLLTLAAKYPHVIKEIRGLGLLTAIELHSDDLVSQLSLRCQELGLLVTPTRKSVVRLIPDLLISEAEIQHGLKILESARASIETWLAAAS